MVEVIRNKWCDDLEDLLQCPICMIRPKAWIYQCVQGHHICEDCKLQLSACPTCTQRWSSARNRLAETLCSKLDEIKLSLIDPESEINKLLVPDRVSVSSQTDVVAEAAGSSTIQVLNDHNGPYPCKIGGCNKNLFYAPLVNHIKTDHSTQYVEMQMGDGNVFENIWYFDFIEQMTFDRAFSVTGMGTFFLKLASDVFGNLTGFILMLHNGFIAKQFTYQLEIFCCPDHNNVSTYTGEVCSCRTPASVLHEKCLQIKRADIQRMLEHTRKLRCNVLVGKKPNTEEEDRLKFFNQKKKYLKNKRNPGRPPPQTNFQNAPKPGPSNHPPMNNRPRRPQTTPNGQTDLPYYCRTRDLSLQSRGTFQNNNGVAPSITGSIPSLLYPNLQNL